MPRLRVAYILLWFPEPSQTFILDEANTIYQLGVELQVYTLYGPRPTRRIAGMGPVAPPVKNLGVTSLLTLAKELLNLKHPQDMKTWRFLFKVLLRRWRSLETAAEAGWAILAGVHLARLFKEARINHIHAPWADGPATAAWVASALSGIPFSFCAHAGDIFPPDGAWTEKAAAASFIRTISEANCRYLKALAPREAAKLVKIYYGSPLRVSSVLPRSPQPPYRLMALGRLVQTKGFDVLLQACRYLADWQVEFNLTLGGDGRQRQHLLHLIRKYDLSKRVEMPGYIPHNQVPRLLKQSDLFIMPCRVDSKGDRDGIPNVILEAMAHAIPVVATDVSGIPEAVGPETGWLVPPENPLELAKAIKKALFSPSEARRRALAGQRLITKMFDSQRNYEQLRDCFEKVVKKILVVASDVTN